MNHVNFCDYMNYRQDKKILVFLHLYQAGIRVALREQCWLPYCIFQLH